MSEPAPKLNALMPAYLGDRHLLIIKVDVHEGFLAVKEGWVLGLQRRHYRLEV